MRGSSLPSLAVVTASLDLGRTLEFWGSWRARSAGEFALIAVVQGDRNPPEELIDQHAINLIRTPEVLGPVPAFELGLQSAALAGFDITACLHDDLRIDSDGWDLRIRRWFGNVDCTLAGFGGGIGLGREGMYKQCKTCWGARFTEVVVNDAVPAMRVGTMAVGRGEPCEACDGTGLDLSHYDPMSLARRDFVSNMENAEAHGRRVTHPVRVACLDGFSQVARTPWLLDKFRRMREAGVVHHFLDSALGCYARREGGKVWMVPLPCHHHGGLSTTNPAYLKRFSDQENWNFSHAWGYREFKDVLPF